LNTYVVDVCSPSHHLAWPFISVLLVCPMWITMTWVAQCYEVWGKCWGIYGAGERSSCRPLLCVNAQVCWNIGAQW